MEEMKSSALERGMSRRSLLKWAGLATVGSAALGATGCVGFNEKTPISDTGDVDENPGEWIPCSCWVDCGSKGFNKGDADVFPTQNVLCCEPQRFPILHRTHPSQ